MGDEVGASRETDERIAAEVMGWVRDDSLQWWKLPKPTPGRGLCTRFANDGWSQCWGTVDPYFVESDDPKAEGGHWHPYMKAPRFAPSTDRSAALEVVDRLIAGGLEVLMATDFSSYKGWNVEVFTCDVEGPESIARRHDRTLALAICRAALDPRVLAALSTHPAAK